MKIGTQGSGLQRPRLGNIEVWEPGLSSLKIEEPQKNKNMCTSYWLTATLVPQHRECGFGEIHTAAWYGLQSA